MSLKENIEMVKEELSQEEKMFESAVKTERFVKKYKMPLIGAIVAVIVVIAGNAIYQANISAKAEASNGAYLALLASPTDASAQVVLKDNNPALFDAWKLQVAMKNMDEKTLEILKASKNDVVADLAMYELATIKQDSAALSAYSQKSGAILKDMALLNEAVLLMKADKIEEAHARLAQIDEKSSLKNTAKMLQHYGVK